MRQSKDHYAILFGISLVLLTFFLILDVQTGWNLRGGYLPIPKHPKLPAVQMMQNQKKFSLEISKNHGNTDEKKVENTLAALQKKIGQNFAEIGQIFDTAQKDHFDNLQQAIDYIEMSNVGSASEVYEMPTLGQILSQQPNENTTILDKFNYEIKQCELYAERSETIDVLIQEMATREIVYVEEKTGGTQIKMTMHLDNGMLALAKPMRFPRDQQTLENHVLFADYERHTADIASFHLDRVLGFRRAFPVTGRSVNLTSEIFNICTDKLRNTFFTSLQPYNNLCFTGTCHRYCDLYHPVCGQNGLIEASFIAFFPIYMGVKNVRIIHPWRKSYDTKRRALWERDPKYCEKIKIQAPYNKGRRLLDLMDMAIFDFLTGNMDRHHYEIFDVLGEEAFAIHYDNGRGFGRPYFDCDDNLAPLVQCCMIRLSTLKALLRFQNGPKPLSQLMRESMAGDPVAPVLLEPHLVALDRRVTIILSALRDCIKTHSIHDVIFANDLP